jgi:hypothetical protein
LPRWIGSAGREEAIEGIQRGEQAAAEGRERRWAEFFVEQRAKYNFLPPGRTLRRSKAAPMAA